MTVAIIGGGITGLSAAWMIHKLDQSICIDLYEKTDRLGGWIQTKNIDGVVVELGPRSFQTNRCPHLLELIQDLNLPILQKESGTRYLLKNKKLVPISSLLYKHTWTILKEPFLQKGPFEDETIYEFAKRRFSKAFAEDFFDPMTLGVYAGDIKDLSMKACFPKIYDLEKKFGSIVMGLLKSRPKSGALFTLKNGMYSLIEKIQSSVPMNVFLNSEVKKLEDDYYQNGQKIQADHFIDASPIKCNKQSLHVVNVIFENKLLKYDGFGYLVPSKENQNLLGMIFDSSIFPDQDAKNITKLTVMIRKEDQDPVFTAFKAIKEHLHIQQDPIFVHQYLAKDAIAQYGVGASDSKGVSVEDCVKRGIELAKQTVSLFS